MFILRGGLLNFSIYLAIYTNNFRIYNYFNWHGQLNFVGQKENEFELTQQNSKCIGQALTFYSYGLHMTAKFVYLYDIDFTMVCFGWVTRDL